MTRTEYDGTITVLMDKFDGKPLNSPNDVVVKSDDSIWFTDPPAGISSNYQGEAAKQELPNNVYRLDPRTGRATVMARGCEHAVGPQRHRPVARLVRKPQRLRHQPRTDAEPARLGLHQQQAQPRHFLGLLHQQDRAHVLPIALGNPAPLAGRIEVLDEVLDDARDVGFEGLVPTVLVGVETSMEMGPAVSGPVKEALTSMRAKWQPMLEAQKAGTLDIKKLSPGDRDAWEHGVALSAIALGALLDYPPVQPADIKAPTLWLVGAADASGMENVKQFEGKLAGTKVTFKPLAGLSYTDSFARIDPVLADVEPFLASTAQPAS